MKNMKRIVGELHQALPPATVRRIFAYLPYMRRRDETTADVIGFILTLVRKGKLPYRATEQELHAAVTANMEISSPVDWAHMEYDRCRGSATNGLPIVAQCAVQGCRRSELSLSGEGSLSGVSVAGWLARGGGMKYFCRKHRKEMGFGDWIGFHEASRRVAQFFKERRKEVALETRRRKADEASNPFAKLAKMA